MTNLEFSVPYSDDPQALTEIFKLKTVGSNTIREVYLAGPQQYSGSGRITDELNIEQFTSILDRIHSEGLRANLVLNSTCEGTAWYAPKMIDENLDYLVQMYQEHGLEAVTIASPIFIKLVRKRLPNIEICASVLGDIDCVQRAVIFAEAGAKVITTDVNINRNLELLKEIKQTTKAEIKLMVNEGCLYKCPFRKFHFNYISHKSKEMGEMEGQCFFFNCLPVINRDNSQLLRSGWIRPEDARKYCGISSYFKIVGRSCASAMVVRATRAYLEEKWDGDLFDLISGPLNLFAVGHGGYVSNKTLGESGFFEKVTACNGKCHECNYCRKLISKLLKLGVLTQEKMDDLGPAGLREVVNTVAKIEKTS
ncbi:U32 family peptidase [Chloroflexota bacterium]